VLLARTFSGRWLPLNAEPDRTGTVTLRGAYTEPLSEAQLDRARTKGWPKLWLPHAATCSHAEEVRRRLREDAARALRARDHELTLRRPGSRYEHERDRERRHGTRP
jgi:hypothetical protein